MDTPNRRPAVPVSAATLRLQSAWTGAPAVGTERLIKVFGDGTRALNGLSVRVAQGEFFGLLGPRGSGKSTAMRILATVLRPDAGRAGILGFDVRVDAGEVRRRIGYVPQQPSVDTHLTGREHLLLMARLHGLSRREARGRTEELLALLGLTTLSDRQTGHYPLEARKRLALACSLVHHPRLLLLDDPTAGLPPHDYASILQCLRQINREEKVTVLLATHLLEEAEGLCSRVAILDAGRAIATGSPAELKAQVAGSTVAVRLVDPARIGEVAALLERLSGVRAVRPQRDRLELEVSGGSTVPTLLRLLEEHEIAVRDVALSRSSLDEVFFRHTGRKIRDLRESPPTGTGVSGRK